MLREDKQVENELSFFNLSLYNEALCQKCKGKKCCQHFPCSYAPTDFIVLREKNKYNYDQKVLILTELIRLGKISIDMIWYKDHTYGPLNCMNKKPDIDKIYNDDGFLFLRARAKGRPVVDFQYFLDETKYYPCINWTLEKGCALTKAERPYTGRMLVPIVGACKDFTDYDEFVEAWREHKVLMYDVYWACRNL